MLIKKSICVVITLNAALYAGITQIEFVNKSSSRTLFYQEQCIHPSGSMNMHITEIKPQHSQTITIDENHDPVIGYITVPTLCKSTPYQSTLYNYRDLKKCNEYLQQVTPTIRPRNHKRTSQNYAQQTTHLQSIVSSMLHNHPEQSDSDWLLDCPTNNKYKNLTELVAITNKHDDKNRYYDITYNQNDQKNYCIKPPQDQPYALSITLDDATPDPIVLEVSVTKIRNNQSHNTSDLHRQHSTTANEKNHDFLSTVQLSNESTQYSLSYCNIEPTQDMYYAPLPDNTPFSPVSQPITLSLENDEHKTLALQVIDNNNTQQPMCAYIINQETSGIIRLCNVICDECDQGKHVYNDECLSYVSVHNNIPNSWNVRLDNNKGFYVFLPKKLQLHNKEKLNITISLCNNDASTESNKKSFFSLRKHAQIIQRQPFSLVITLDNHGHHERQATTFQIVTRKLSQLFSRRYSSQPVAPALENTKDNDAHQSNNTSTEDQTTSSQKPDAVKNSSDDNSSSDQSIQIQPESAARQASISSLNSSALHAMFSRQSSTQQHHDEEDNKSIKSTRIRPSSTTNTYNQQYTTNDDDDYDDFSISTIE